MDGEIRGGFDRASRKYDSSQGNSGGGDWDEKTCKGKDCTNVIRYKRSWEHIPNYCKSCKAARSNERENFVRSRTRRDRTDIFYGPKGSTEHGHIVQKGPECDDVAYSRTPDGEVEYDDQN